MGLSPKYLMVSFSIALVGCTTAAPTSNLKSLPQQQSAAKTGVIVPVRFLSKNSILSDEGCDISVRQVGGLTTLKEIHVETGTSISLADLDPGVYSYREFRCGLQSADISFQKLPNFAVFADKMSLMGPVVIGLTKDRQLGFWIAPLNKKLIHTVLGELKKQGVNDEVVSAYTGKPIIESGQEIK